MQRLILITYVMFCYCLAWSQDFGNYAPGSYPEGVVYFLPKTNLQIEITAVETKYTPGELCNYANRFLRLTNISGKEDTKWELVQVTVKSIGVPDPENVYIMKDKDKSVASQIELTNNGIIKAINTKAPENAIPTKKTQAPINQKVDARKYMTEEILSASSHAKMAELIAKEIYSIRESKNSLTRGQAEYMPSDGAALKLMLENLELQEKALTQLFTGTIEQTEKTIVINIEPKENVDNKIVFRFSKKLGVLDAANLAGEPVFISVKSTDLLPVVDPKVKEKKKTEGVIYNIPGKGKVHLASKENIFFDGELPITQFGEIEVLTAGLFNKKINTRVIFNTDTGGIIKIDKD